MTLAKRLLLASLLLSGATLIGLWWWARGSLPLWTAICTWLACTRPVEVLLDDHGVPHVYASGQDDAWFAAGVLHARERLWQMELYRRAARGRLSEVLGSPTLRIDRRFATLELGAGAESEWRASAPEVREALTRYADGVNAQVALMTGRRKPIEFQVLGFTPAPWTPVDSLVVGRLLAWRLAENHQSELVRHALAARFGADDALRLGGRYPADAPTVMQGSGIGDQGSGTGDQGAGIGDQGSGTRDQGSGIGIRDQWRGRRRSMNGRTVSNGWRRAPRRGNSNNWVISGRRTASGRPLLANDPHLQVELPGVWYELHLVAAGLNVAGVSIPGTPFVVLGHNAAIAWGMTNTGADVQDLFIERVDVARRRYLYRGQWLPVSVTETEIPVRGEPPQKFEVWRTRHGAIFADVGLEWEDAPPWLSPSAERSGERRAFALTWDISGETAGAFEAFNRADGWDEFTRAIERFAAPSQNFVYADVEGNIGYAMSGVLPVRSNGVGLLPSDGPSGEGEWSGTIAPSLLPRVLNPASGYITSSNNQIDRKWTGLITRDWAAPYRTTRLNQADQRRDADRHAEGGGVAERRDGARAGRRAVVGGVGHCCRREEWRRRDRDRPAEAASRLGQARRRPGGRDAVSPVRGSTVAADVHRRDGRAAVQQVLRMGGRRAARRSLRNRERSAVEVVGRHRDARST